MVWKEYKNSSPKGTAVAPMGLTINVDHIQGLMPLVINERPFGAIGART